MRVIGTGSIKPVDGKSEYKARRWRLRADVEVDGRRTQRSAVFEGTKREALKALEAFKSDLEGQVPNADDFASYAASWLAWRASAGIVSQSTCSKDARRVAALCREFGRDRMDALTPERCRMGLLAIRDGNNARGRVLSNTYMQALHVTLSTVMRQAADDGRIASNPMERVKAPKADTREKKAMTRGQLAAFLDAVDAMPVDGRTACVYLIACLGLRRGEAVALAVEDVADGCIRVRRAYKESTGEVGAPKSDSGVRTLPMPPRLRAYVEGRVLPWRESHPGADAAPWLCLAPQGGIIHTQKLEAWWKKVRDGLGADGYNLHELRHTNLTIMASSPECSAFTLMRWAGWSSIEPARVYVHDDRKAVAAAAMDAFKGL